MAKHPSSQNRIAGRLLSLVATLRQLGDDDLECVILGALDGRRRVADAVSKSLSAHSAEKDYEQDVAPHGIAMFCEALLQDSETFNEIISTHFENYDRDEDGVLDPEEFEGACLEVWRQVAADPPRDHLASLEQFDASGEGSINRAEFEAFFRAALQEVQARSAGPPSPRAPVCSPTALRILLLGGRDEATDVMETVEELEVRESVTSWAVSSASLGGALLPESSPRGARPATPLASQRPAWRRQHSSAPRQPGRAGHVAVVAGDGKLILCGGRNQDGEGLSSVEVFDPTSGSWSQGPPMLSARVNAAASVSASGRCYICGGEGNDEEALKTTEVLDLNNLEEGWRPGAVLQTARNGVTSAIYQDRLYVIGGNDFANFVGSRTRSWKTVEVLNIESKPSGAIAFGHTRSTAGKLETLLPWETGPALKVGRCFAVSAVLGGLVYVAGGSEDGFTPLSSVEVLDRDGKAWGPGPKLAVGRIGPAGTVIENALYLSGGRGEKFEALSSVEVLDPEVRQAWVPGPPLLAARCHAAAGTVGVFANLGVS